MSEEAERRYLIKKMKNDEASIGFPISYPNQPFNIPVNAPYGEFYIVKGPKPVVVAGEGKGKVRVRRVGFVQLTVWVPKDKGLKVGTDASDKFADIFQFELGRDEAGSVYCFEALQTSTPDTKAGWSCVVLRVPYHRDTVETIKVSI